MDKYFRRNRPAASNVKRLLDDIHGRFPRCSTGLQGHRSSRFELHPRLLLEAIVTKVEKNTGHRNSPSTDYIQREHLFARFAFHVLSEANFRFLGGVHKYSVRLFDLRRAEHFTAELYSDNIEELCEIFPSLNSTRGLSSQGRETPPSQQPDDSYDDTSDSDGEAPLSHHGDALKYRQAARKRYRSPAYYTFRFYPKGYIDTANTEHEEATKDRGNPRPASSTGGLSLASTLTVSSLKTPTTDRGSEDLAGPNDKSNLDATQICSKHPSDRDGLTNASPPGKRRRLA
ncbi:hypothetical protein NUW58_g7962 [Xylaria curta]|uniref:Uncharacterized protein n=1 Tax=Xylaria curta TaxID=42375 RepID=A0ACC1NCC5_9PEZI|nr:hypothetical protein NUW58_g7962 [Xylaria curta]